MVNVIFIQVSSHTWMYNSVIFQERTTEPCPPYQSQPQQMKLGKPWDTHISACSTGLCVWNMLLKSSKNRHTWSVLSVVLLPWVGSPYYLLQTNLIYYLFPVIATRFSFRGLIRNFVTKKGKFSHDSMSGLVTACTYPLLLEAWLCCPHWAMSVSSSPQW